MIIVCVISGCMSPLVKETQADESHVNQDNSSGEPDEVVNKNPTAKIRRAVMQSWVNPDFSTDGVGKVLVMAVIDNESRRSQYEIELTAALVAKGINAVPRANILRLQGTPSQGRIKWFLNNDQFDHLLVTRVCPLEENEIRQTGNNQFELAEVRGQWGPYWENSEFETTYTRDIEKLARLFVETSLFETGQGRVIWRNRNETVDPQYTESPAEFIATVTSRLLADGLIQ